MIKSLLEGFSNEVKRISRDVGAIKVKELSVKCK